MPAQQPSSNEKASAVLARTRRAGILLAVCLSCLHSSDAFGEEYALIVGGGPNPSRNPVSLETQVLQAIDVLQARKLKRFDVLFADGDAPEKDLVDQTADPWDKKTPEALLALKYFRLLYDPDYSLSEPTRNHRIPNSQAATEANIRRWFENEGKQLQSRDRLLIYFATHGTRIDFIVGEPDYSDVHLWKDGSLNAKELRSLIQQLPTGVEVTLIVTSCYSSGFSEPGQLNLFGLPDQPRDVGGYFSSLPNRPAAGCTPQAFSIKSKDYATCFWAAQAAHWPDNTKLEVSPDFNQDNQVTFAEAHAFALLADNTLDTPQKRSDIVLRQISRYGKLEETDLLMNDAPYDDILSEASELDKHILQQLSEELKLTGRRRIATARRELREISDVHLRRLLEQRQALDAKLPPLREQLNERLQTKSPIWIYETLYQVARSRERFPPDFVENLKGQPEFAAIKALVADRHAIDQQRLELETTWAKYWRFVNVAESVILAHNLRELEGSSEDLKAFQQLLAAEEDF